ncbi:MAG: DMT family transporter [Alphaproteobacteria bacterium]|nr:DMT family transporter [Alphaproteobacteria bacterium]
MSQGALSAVRRPRLGDVALLCLLAATWGGSFPATKVAVTYLSNTSVVAGRVLIGAVFMGLLVRWAGHRLPSDRDTWIKFAGIALTGNLMPFLLIAFGQRRIDAGLAAILMAVMPLTTLVLAHAFTSDERLNARRLTGVVLGMAGIVTLVGVDALGGLGSDVIGQLAVAGAAACYAVQTIIARHLRGPAPLVTATCVVCLTALMAVPLMLFEGLPPAAPPTAAILAILFLGLGSNGVGYTVFFHLVGTVGATFTANNNYLVPVAGVLWSALILAERPSARALVALALILAGIAIAHWRPAKKA